jgi:hypothetical protein
MEIFQISASVALLAVAAVVAWKALAGLRAEIKRLEAEEAE